MEEINVKVEKLTEDSFKPFGDLIGMNKREPNYSNEAVSYWTGFSFAGDMLNTVEINWAEIKEPKPFSCTSLEKHFYTAETIIPMKGHSICLFGLSRDSEKDDSEIDFGSFKAFILNNDCCVNIKIGVWHTQPWILSRMASFVVLVRKDTQEKDLVITDLLKDYNKTINIIL